MREILFRGKRLHDNKWIYGNFVSDCEGNPHIIEPRFFCEDGHHLQYEDNTDTPVFIIPETVGQFTGLTDKNGKRIFEGDIVECWSEGVKACGTVQQRIDGLWIIYPAWQKRIMWGLCPDNDGNTTVEIVGNIHDNPELME